MIWLSVRDRSTFCRAHSFSNDGVPALKNEYQVSTGPWEELQEKPRSFPLLSPAWQQGSGLPCLLIPWCCAMLHVGLIFLALS